MSCLMMNIGKPWLHYRDFNIPEQEACISINFLSPQALNNRTAE
jgi:hypothetical protein